MAVSIFDRVSGKETDDDMRHHIVALHDSGHSNRNITRLTGITKSTVRDIITRWKARGTVVNAPRPGAPSKLSLGDRVAMTRYCKKNRAATPAEIQTYFRDTRGVDVSLTTLWRARRDLGWMRKKGNSHPILTAKHKVDRVDWCCAHLDDDFTTVIFTDEKNFVLHKIVGTLLV